MLRYSAKELATIVGRWSAGQGPLYHRLAVALRRLIEQNELSRYQIAKQSGVDAAQLHRFLKGTGRLTNDSLDKIGKVLHLRFEQD